MQAPATPANEVDRLATLHALRILDTPADDRFDRYTRIGARIFDMPITLISLVDSERQWFKAATGLDATETPRDISFCGHAILGDGIFEVQNARRDLRFRDNPLVLRQPNIRFYAGAPLEAPNGQKLGTLCLIDRIPRKLNGEDRMILENLADMVVGEIVNHVDVETGLANRNALLVNGAKLFRRPARDRHFSVLLFDINESIVSGNGASRSNTACVKFADLLRKYFPNAYLAAHIDGNYFCVVLDGNAVAEAEKVMRQVCSEARLALKDDDKQADYLPLIGCVNFDPETHHTINDVIREADVWFFGRNKKRIREDIEPNRFLDAIFNWRKSIF